MLQMREYEESKPQLKRKKNKEDSTMKMLMKRSERRQFSTVSQLVSAYFYSWIFEGTFEDGYSRHRPRDDPVLE